MSEGGKRTVISLGGSLVVPDAIDTGFLQSFKAVIEDRIAAGEKFLIIVGGGKTARTYIQAGQEIASLSPEDQDWVGIFVTRLNASFLRALFGGLAYEEIVTDPNMIPDTHKPVIFGAGWKPGASTDRVAVVAAQQVGATKLLNLSNTDYVYNKDPKTHPDARAFPALSWDDYRALVPAEWRPGLSAPFDPIASKEAQEAGLQVLIINGAKLKEVRNGLAGEAFDGTVIG